MSSTNNTNLRNILVNLDVISRLEKMDKLNTYYQNFIREKPSVITSFSRWFRNDDQLKTCMSLEALVNQCMDSLSKKQFDDNSSIKLIKYLMASRNGIENLRYTYSDNDTTNAMLTLIIETIDEIPNMFKEWYKKVEEEYKHNMLTYTSLHNGHDSDDDRNTLTIEES